LAVSRRIVLQHQGSLTGENHPDGGAIFTVELPPAKDELITQPSLTESQDSTHPSSVPSHRRFDSQQSLKPEVLAKER
jgi:hypothetical protein